jgi:D-amino peptidase
MRIYLSVDMEGATGVTGPDDVNPGKPAYERFRKLLTRDVNAAIEGANKGGATKIVVNEAHNGMRNILIEELNPKAEMISGFTKPLCMMEGIDETFDAAFLIAYHARAGTKAGVLNHTLFGKEIVNIKINEKLVGETAISSILAGYFGVPVVLVTGDDKVAREAVDLLGDVETAIVKEGMDRYVAKCLTPEESARKIKESAEKAMGRVKEFKPYEVKTPIKFEVEFISTAMAALTTLIPGVKREESRTISLTSQNILEGYKKFWAALLLSSTAADKIFG